MRTLATGCWVDSFYLHWDDVLIKCERFAELAHRGAAFRWAVEAYAAAMTACCAIGDLEQAQYYAAASLEAAEGLRDRYWLATAFWRNETVNGLRGDWPTGRHFSDHGLALAPLDPRLLASRALLEYEVGEFSQGKEFLERLVGAMRLSPRGPTPGFARVAMVIPLTARVSSTVDRLGIAEEAVEELVDKKLELLAGLLVFQRQPHSADRDREVRRDAFLHGPDESEG